MRTELQDQLYSALYACLRPLVRFLLRSGVTYQQFADLSKHAFVQEAYLQVGGSMRRGNDSRVASKTGISRKEIKRIKDLRTQRLTTEEWLGEKTYAAPARVMHLWNLDPEYLECDGNPKRLKFDGDEPSFTGLVKRCAGDIPPGAVRDELLQSGAIAEDETGTLRVLKKFYIPDDVDEKALSTLSLILFPIVSGLDHNLRKDRAPQGFIQRFAYSEVLDSEALVEFRAWARSKAAEFVEQVDVWLAAHEHRTRTPSNNQSTPSEVQAGLGVFYYEGPTIGDVITSSKDVSD